MEEDTKLNKREKQRMERRQQILECSLDMIIARGYEAMKIRDIANKLNISTGLFFNYFESKEKIYEELVKIGLAGPKSIFKMNMDEIEPIEFFERMTETVFESLISYSITGKMFLLMAQTMKSETAPESVKNMVAHFDAVTTIVSVIRSGQNLGQIKEGDPVALAVAYWGAVQGVAESFVFLDNLPLPKSSWIVDILRK